MPMKAGRRKPRRKSRRLRGGRRHAGRAAAAGRRDDALARIKRPIPVCADESVHGRASLAALAGKYDAVNIKLDKTGGLTEALALAARRPSGWASGFMVGCMVATSLAMAPAMLVAQRARVVDLDGPLLLARDRPDGLRYEGSLVHPRRRRCGDRRYNFGGHGDKLQP